MGSNDSLTPRFEPKFQLRLSVLEVVVGYAGTSLTILILGDRKGLNRRFPTLGRDSQKAGREHVAHIPKTRNFKTYFRSPFMSNGAKGFRCPHLQWF